MSAPSMSLCVRILRVDCGYSCSPGFVENIMLSKQVLVNPPKSLRWPAEVTHNVLDVLISPHSFMTPLQRLERIILIPQRNEFPIKHIRQQILIGEFECLDYRILVQRRRDAGEGFEGRMEDDETGIEEFVSWFREFCGRDGDRVLRESVGAICWDPRRTFDELGCAVTK